MDGNDNQMNFSADDLVGILIHNANQAASALSVNGVNVEWPKFMIHLARMYEVAQRAQAMVTAANEAAAAAQTN